MPNVWMPRLASASLVTDDHGVRSRSPLVCTRIPDLPGNRCTRQVKQRPARLDPDNRCLRGIRQFGGTPY